MGNERAEIARLEAAMSGLPGRLSHITKAIETHNPARPTKVKDIVRAAESAGLIAVPNKGLVHFEDPLGRKVASPIAHGHLTVSTHRNDEVRGPVALRLLQAIELHTRELGPAINARLEELGSGGKK